MDERILFQTNFQTIQSLAKLSPLDLFTTFNNHWTNHQQSTNTPLSLLISTIKQEGSFIKLYQILSDLLNQSGENYDIACNSLLDFIGKHMESVQLYLIDFGGRLDGMQHMIKSLELLKIHNDQLLSSLYHKVIHWNEEYPITCKWAVTAATCLLSFGFADSKIEEIIQLAVNYEPDLEVRTEGIRGVSILTSKSNELSPLQITHDWKDCNQSGLCQWLNIKIKKNIVAVDTNVSQCLLQGNCSFVASEKIIQTSGISKLTTKAIALYATITVQCSLMIMERKESSHLMVVSVIVHKIPVYTEMLNKMLTSSI